MNTFHDLLDRYANPDGLRVDAREWLMLLELDPHTAVKAMTHLAILAAEDLTLQFAARAHAALAAAGTRADACPTATAAAQADLTAFADRITAARGRAFTIWTERIRPLLLDVGVLVQATTAAVSCPPRTWVNGWVRLPGIGDRAYPASIATRRRHTGYPIVRFDRTTCDQIAADISAARTADPHRYGAANLLPPAILTDADQSVLTIGADTVEQAWARDASVLCPDPDGLYLLGARRWPWQIDTNERTVQRTRHSAPRAPGSASVSAADRDNPTTCVHRPTRHRERAVQQVTRIEARAVSHRRQPVADIRKDRLSPQPSTRW
jgi:hypothetical protein